MNGMPLVFTGWALWLLLAKRASYGVWRGGLIVMIFLSTAIFTVIRMEGLQGAGMPDMYWRWQKSAEEEYLARRNSTTAPAQAKGGTVALRVTPQLGMTQECLPAPPATSTRMWSASAVIGKRASSSSTAIIHGSHRTP